MQGHQYDLRIEAVVGLKCRLEPALRIQPVLKAVGSLECFRPGDTIAK